jgi:uncharacterized protein (UPF0332 family)
MVLYKDFEKIANLLENESRTLSDSQREVALRRAISTIYYGVFWELRERLKRRGFKIRNRQPHSTVLKIVKELNPYIGKLLEDLKKHRELADYQSNWQPDIKKFYYVKYLANLILMEV